MSSSESRRREVTKQMWYAAEDRELNQTRSKPDPVDPVISNEVRYNVSGPGKMVSLLPRGVERGIDISDSAA